MFCKNCGCVVEDNTDLCDKCILKMHRQRKTKKRRAVKKWIVALMLIVLIGGGYYIISNAQEAKNASESEKKRESHDKSRVRTEYYSRAERNMGALGYIIKDEDVLEKDLDDDGKKEKVYFYIDGPHAYVEINGKETYSASLSGSMGGLDNYLIVLPIGNNMFGLIISSSGTANGFSSVVLCCYDDEVTDSHDYKYHSVASGGLRVEMVDGEYTVRGSYDRLTFDDGKIYSGSSW